MGAVAVTFVRARVVSRLRPLCLASGFGGRELRGGAVLGAQPADRLGGGAHNDRVGFDAAAGEFHAAEQRTVGDAGRSEGRRRSPSPRLNISG